MLRYISIVSILVLMNSCVNKTPKILEIGTWRATLGVQDSKKLPFIFKVHTENKITIHNAEEVIIVDEIEYRNDSVFIKTPVFQSYIAAKFINDSTIEGSYIKEDLNRIVPFRAEYHVNERFKTSKPSAATITGNWETVFSPNIEEDRYLAKGIFNQAGNKVTGTIRTTTGDYRYLEGVVEGDEFKLSTFDGAHAFLFTGKIIDSTLQGTFYSGNHFQEPFIAKRNEAYELPDANELTFLKAGYDKLEFSFPDVNGNLVSLEDERFKNKVVIVQLMGTWCPNCLDESKFYSQFYKGNKNNGLEIVALAFEYAKTNEAAFKNMERLKQKIDIGYPILLAQTGTSSKVEAQEKLPMLNHVLSYPTTIFIDKKGSVRKIHTGFNGPATGEKYIAFKTEFEAFVEKLLEE